MEDRDADWLNLLREDDRPFGREPPRPADEILLDIPLMLGVRLVCSDFMESSFVSQVGDVASNLS